jgi:hypothetical protein
MLPLSGGWGEASSLGAVADQRPKRGERCPVWPLGLHPPVPTPKSKTRCSSSLTLCTLGPATTRSQVTNRSRSRAAPPRDPPRANPSRISEKRNGTRKLYILLLCLLCARSARAIPRGTLSLRTRADVMRGCGRGEISIMSYVDTRRKVSHDLRGVPRQRGAAQNGLPGSRVTDVVASTCAPPHHCRFGARMAALTVRAS